MLTLGDQNGDNTCSENGQAAGTDMLIVVKRIEAGRRLGSIGIGFEFCDTFLLLGEGRSISSEVAQNAERSVGTG